MPSDGLESELAEAVYSFVQHGAYPDTEDVIAAELPSSALPGTLKLLQNARQEIHVSP